MLSSLLGLWYEDSYRNAQNFQDLRHVQRGLYTHRISLGIIEFPKITVHFCSYMLYKPLRVGRRENDIESKLH